MPQKPPTQDPTQGQGQQQGDAGSNQKDATTVALEALQAQLAQQEAARKALEQQLSSQGETLRKFQSEKDRLERAAKQPALPQAQPRGGPAPTPALQQLRDMEQAAADAAKEAMLLRELMTRGLSEKDVEGLEFNSPTELTLALDVIQMKKETQALRQSMTDAAEKAKTQQDTVVDAGGPTGQRATTDNTDSTVALDNEYVAARKLGTTQEARWRLLQAIHKDPRKRMSGTSEG